MHPLFDLSGKTALITGASSGLGERFAYALSGAGAQVILVARRLDKLEILSKNIKNSIVFKMDVRDKKSIQTVFDQLEKQGEKIDICINDAGIVSQTSIFDIENDDNVEDIIQTNLMGVWYVTKAAAIHMKNHEIAGSIINISSVCGHNRIGRKLGIYCASKAAVSQMTKALVGELSEYNIRINAIVPGTFLTPMASNAKSTYIPAGFVAEPSDLDAAILYLASNKASRYVTGSTITVDGGASWGGYIAR